MRVFNESAAKTVALEGRTIAVAGYGNQGRPQALNLRESGCRVIVGAREGGAGASRAREDGFEVARLADAARASDIFMMLLPDEVQGEVYRRDIRGALRPGAALSFAHGFSVAFGEIPREGFDLILVAPKGQGGRLREAYLAGTGLPCLVGVEHDVSGHAEGIALSLAAGLGCLRAGAYETSFREEAVSDLFGEQAVLCGGVPALVKRAFGVLVARGYRPEVAYFECVHELEIIVELFTRLGFSGMRDVISGTAAYGSLAFGEPLVGEDVERKMERLFEGIESGAFAKAWLEERRAGGGTLAALRARERELLVEKVGRSVRARMPDVPARRANEEKKGT
jgi:ketol-acid reductoisomerase